MAKGKSKSKKITIEDALVPVEEQPYEVPENWCWVYLENLCEYMKVGGDKPSDMSDTKSDELNVPVIANGIQNEGIVGYTAIPIIEDKTVTVSGRGTIGHSVYRDYPYYPIVRLIVLKTNQCLQPQYLKYIFDYFEEEGTGSSIPQLTVPSIKKKNIPLPPLAEQKRIVKQIENLFAELDVAREKVECVISCFEERKVAIIHKAFDGALTRKWREANNVSCDSWEMVPLKNCGRWFGGGTPTTSVDDYWKNGDIPWITSKDMKDRVIEDSIMHITMDGVENSSANYCDKPAVLFVMRSGILRRVLPVCMVNRPFTVNQDLKACVPTINQDYLYWFCTGYEKDIRDKCMKSGTTVESVEAKKLMDYEVPVASANEQIEVVKQIENLINKEEIVKELAENVIEKIDVMKKSILAKAFRGELGTNNPEEESAIELLKTILDNGDVNS